MTDDNVIDFNKQDKSSVETPEVTADSSLKEAIGQFETVLVIGIEDSGKLGFVTNYPNYAFMQYVLNKASFELLVHERANDA